MYLVLHKAATQRKRETIINGNQNANECGIPRNQALKHQILTENTKIIFLYLFYDCRKIICMNAIHIYLYTKRSNNFINSITSLIIINLMQCCSCTRCKIYEIYNIFHTHTQTQTRNVFSNSCIKCS